MASHKILTKAIEPPQDDTPLPVAELLALRDIPKTPRLQHALRLFRGEKADVIFQEINHFILEQTGSAEIHILRMFGEEFEDIDYKTKESVIYPCRKMSGMSDALFKKAPVLLDKSFTAPWKGIFFSNPEYLILIPVIISAGKTPFIVGTAAIAYYYPIPRVMEEAKTWHILLDYLQLTVPLLINVHRYEESESKKHRFVEALDALAKAERDIQDLQNCVRSVAYEIARFLSVKYVQVLLIFEEVEEDRKFRKICNLGAPEIRPRCPMPGCHYNEELNILPETCVGCAATRMRMLRANDASDLEDYGISARDIHSIGGCIVDNILCIPLLEHSSEVPLLLELSEKKGGFSQKDEEQASLFSKRAAAILTSAILLDNKKKAVRRHVIRNEVLANIGEVSYIKVNQMLDLKFDYSSSFKKKLMDFGFSMRIFPDTQSPSIILYMFIDLGFVQRWNMKKSTLIRFILSMQQGYRATPYHNWKHACSVTHFAYLLLKKLNLVKQGLLNDLEALTLMISCLSHDLDHRGRNNHFNLCTKSELYHLYKQEDSIMERHHIAVALSILNTEECNILQNLSDPEYREFLELIQWNILATDLSKYMQKKMEYVYTLKHFDATDNVHRKHFSAIIMTTADLCEHTKAWDVTLQNIKSVCSEFFQQGDDEKALGLTPMPIMDRKVAYIPQVQVQFINNVVRPAYHALAELLPHTKLLLHTLDYHVSLWLLATGVWDVYEEVEDSLAILDMPEMREKSLRKRNVPHLENVLKERHISPTGVPSKSSLSSLPQEMHTSSLSFKEFEQEEDLNRHSSLMFPVDKQEHRTSCWAFTKNWLCCKVCRFKGLIVARAIRQYGLEDDYLDSRATEFEARIKALNPDEENEEGEKRNSLY